MKCVFKEEIFKSPKNGFCIYKFATKEEIPEDACIKKNGEEKWFKGTGYHIPQRQVDISGEWVYGQYGMQYEIQECVEIIPQTADEIYHYLSSGAIIGVGPTIAKRIVDSYQEDTYKIIETEPKKLLKIKGITEGILKGIEDSFNKSRHIRNIMGQFSSFGVTLSKAERIYNKFGAAAIDVIKENPFHLCEIFGFGFLTVDRIAQNMGCSFDDPIRIKEAIKFALKEASKDGHLFLPAVELLRRTSSLLIRFDNKVEDEKMKAAMKEMAGKTKIIAENGNVYLPDVYHEEINTATKIADLLYQKTDTIENLDVLIAKAQERNQLKLSDTQVQAVKNSFKYMVSIITGGPGTGKTTVLKIIMEIYNEALDNGFLLLAPTGRASRNLSDKTGFEASTIHSGLRLTGEWSLDNDFESIHCGLVIVDESSMVDSYVINQLMQRIEQGTRVIFVGDKDQLPSVGAGNVFKEMIGSGCIPITYLSTIFRQSKGSSIIFNSHKINQGKTDLCYDDDFIFVPASNEIEATNMIKELYQMYVSEVGLESVQVLTPYRNRRLSASNLLNPELRELVNPMDDTKQELNFGRMNLRTGDKVMQTKNKETACNGDIGIVEKINIHEKKVVILYPWGSVEYGTEDIKYLEYAYCTTIHKSQGGEYDIVIIPVLHNYWRMLQRNLYYTGISRGKKKVVLVGQKNGLIMAAKNNTIVQRNTLLGVRIKNCYEKLLKNVPSAAFQQNKIKNVI